MELDDAAPKVVLPMDRPLFSPPLDSSVQDQLPEEAPEAIPTDALFGHEHVEKARLEANIRRALQTRSQISLSELVEDCPIEQGLSELVAYLTLAAEDETALIDDTQRQSLTWTDQATGSRRQATLPLVIYSHYPVASSTPKRLGEV